MRFMLNLGILRIVLEVFHYIPQNGYHSISTGGHFTLFDLYIWSGWECFNTIGRIFQFSLTLFKRDYKNTVWFETYADVGLYIDHIGTEHIGSDSSINWEVSSSILAMSHKDFFIKHEFILYSSFWKYHWNICRRILSEQSPAIQE